MAIKVKHDGNVAPIAAAGVAGGRAKKSMESAKLANFGHSGSAGGGGGGGASPMNPGVMHAPTSSASLTSAPTPQDSLKKRTEAQDKLNAQSDQRRFDNQSRLNQESDERRLAEKMAMADKDAEIQAKRDATLRGYQSERDEAANKYQTERDAALHAYQTERDKTLQGYQAERDKQQFQNQMDLQLQRLDYDAEQKDIDREIGDRRAREEQMIRAGTHEWGYSDEDMRKRAELEQAYSDAAQGGQYSQEDLADLRRQTDEQIGAMQPILRPRTDAQGDFSRNTYTDDTGKVWGRDGKLIYNPDERQFRQQDLQSQQLARLVQTFSKPYVEKYTEKDESGENVQKERTVVPSPEEAMQRAWDAINYRGPNGAQVQNQQAQPPQNPQAGTVQQTVQPSQPAQKTVAKLPNRPLTAEEKNGLSDEEKKALSPTQRWGRVKK